MHIDALDFISRIAWPAVILVVALMYRRLLTKLVTGGITHVRAGPFELAWDQAKSGVERRTSTVERVPHLRSTGTPSAPPESLLGSELAELAESDPREAIFAAYGRVQEALQRALADMGVSHTEAETLDALSLVRLTESSGLTPPETTDAVVGLNVLHNLAKHAPGSGLSASRAYEYLAMADGALYSLASALKHQRPKERSAAA